VFLQVWHRARAALSGVYHGGPDPRHVQPGARNHAVRRRV